MTQWGVVRWSVAVAAAGSLGCAPAARAQDAPPSPPSPQSSPPQRAVADAAPGRIARATAPPSRHRFFPFPFLFYQPETRLGGGVALLHAYETSADARTSANNIFLVYTLRRQFSVQLTGERYTPGNRWRLGGELLVSRFPDKFHGLGNATRTADEEDVTLSHRRVAVDARRAVGSGRYLGLSLLRQRTTIAERDTAGLLAGGVIAGSGGADLLVLGASAMSDRRDNLFAPWRGSYATLTVRRALDVLGGNARYTRVEADLRGYRRIGGGPVLAGQLLATATDGTPPFFELATLGGSSLLRGYYEGRYRDRHRFVAQAEARFPVWRRLGAAAFVAAGEVMPSWRVFALRGLHPALGLGARYALSPADRVNLRIDYAVGRDGSALYFAFGEAY